MTFFFTFFVIFFIVHGLLFASSLLLCKAGWWMFRPSVKQKIARVLFLSCLVSPCVVQFAQFSTTPLLARYFSLDAFHATGKQHILLASREKPESEEPSFRVGFNTRAELWKFSFFALLSVFFLGFLRAFWQLKRLRKLLESAFVYRARRRLRIVISDQCHIPFSFSFFLKSYIVLPVSLFCSSQNLKIAIAHEGQHHRQGDCLWAYLLLVVRVVFCGNPGTALWLQRFGELQELACDDVLVRKKGISVKDYGQCLHDVAKQALFSGLSPLACTVGMARAQKFSEKVFIAKRISLLSNYRMSVSKHAVFFFSMTGLCVVLFPFLAAYAVKVTVISQEDTLQDLSLAPQNPMIQAIAVNAVSQAVDRRGATSAAALVMNPATGKILAFAEAGFVQGKRSWSSRVFAPASTLKPFLVAAALDAHVISPQSTLDCQALPNPAGAKLEQVSLPHALSFVQAMEHSVNDCFIQIAQRLGESRFQQKLNEFGFAVKADSEDPLWLSQAALGTNLPVTLATLAKAYAILANEGRLPHVLGQSAVSSFAARSATDMLVASVRYGTGQRASLATTQVAGKTGTLVPVFTEHFQPKVLPLALFAGYVPAYHPQFVIVVVVEGGHDDKGEGVFSGGQVAAPLFARIAQESLTSEGFR